MFSVIVLAISFVAFAQAHGDHSHDQQPIPPDADWATRHMAEEHHITSFDAGAFFNLHDYEGTNEWTEDDILITYGLKDESTNHISQAEKDKAVQTVIDLYDRDHSNTISFAEFVMGDVNGVKLPDFGFGPGHHGDDEYGM